MLVVAETYDEQTAARTLNATWQEIFDAMKSGKTVMILNDNSDSIPPFIDQYYVNGCGIDPNTGVYVLLAGVQNFQNFYAQSPTEYMTNQEPISDDSGSGGDVGK